MKILTTLSVSLLLSLALQAQQGKGFATAGDAVAFDGNDLISYFENGEPLKGSPKFQSEYHDLNLQFATQTNKQKFETNPSKYLPAYDGWCAIALTQGSWIQPDYNEYKIQDGQLLFFEVRAFYNGRTAWNRDPDIHKIVADHKYEELKRPR